MNNIKIETKTNGYKAEGLQEMISRFEKVAADLFPGCTVSHFYYGDHLDMADIGIGNGNYAHFNITAKRVSMNGLTGMAEDVRKWESMTYNDELYDGKLIELAGF
jgi:hypothetical protein